MNATVRVVFEVTGGEIYFYEEIRNRRTGISGNPLEPGVTNSVMPRVELLFFPGCPHVEAARTQLQAALTGLGFAASWTEWDDAQGYGSPTILVNGVDVMGASPGNDASCRLYVGTEVAGAPPLQALLRALATS